MKIIVALTALGSSLRGYAAGQSLTQDLFLAEQSCQEFEAELPSSSGWLVDDCMSVWNSWAVTVPHNVPLKYNDTDFFDGIVAQHRGPGSHCLVKSIDYPDGAGSMALRHLSTWAYAAEMGCDWVHPKPYKPNVVVHGASLYCHLETANGTTDIKKGDTAFGPSARCTLNNWLEYYSFETHMIRPEISNSTAVIKARTPTELLSGQLRNEQNSPARDQWLVVMDLMTAPRYFLAIGSWNARKRAAVREVLEIFRHSFHRYPRPWHSTEPQCAFSPSTLDVAIHVRLGDRKESLDDDTYFDYLEDFMGNVTSAVLARGHDRPVFHIFSETSSPCPSTEDGKFPEFTRWPVEMNQVSRCVEAEIPPECPEKDAGAPNCNPLRSGIFAVEGREIYLHVGFDVRNELSCMATANAILMGCSTFGQVAGVLNRGIRFFSVECDGFRTSAQYKLIPPMVIADRGHMWVPVSGSWHDPTIASETIFGAALDSLLRRGKLKFRHAKQGPNHDLPRPDPQG